MPRRSLTEKKTGFIIVHVRSTAKIVFGASYDKHKFNKLVGPIKYKWETDRTPFVRD